jgi:tetratricopeptide (TPR) repeat protein
MIRLLVTALVVASLSAILKAQSAAKETLPVSSPYAAEESRAISASIGRKDLDLRAALSAQPNSPELLFAYALVLRHEGKARDSLAVYTHAAAIRKPTADELHSVALDYVILNDYDDAIHWLEKAQQEDPRNTDVLYSLGRCYYSKDRFPDARKLFEKILTIGRQKRTSAWFTTQPMSRRKPSRPCEKPRAGQMRAVPTNGRSSIWADFYWITIGPPKPSIRSALLSR